MTEQDDSLEKGKFAKKVKPAMPQRRGEDRIARDSPAIFAQDTEAMDPQVVEAFRRIEEIRIAEGRQTSELLENKKKLESKADRLKKKLHTDKLTGAYNLEGFAERVRSDPAPATLVIIDLDGFKPINDTYGHAAGDEALKHLTKFFKRHTRQGDVVARIGGDEFALLLHTTEADANHRMEELRDKFTLRGFSHEGRQPYLSFSFGAASLEKGFEAARHAADLVMYTDKNGIKGDDGGIVKTGKQERKARYAELKAGQGSGYAATHDTRAESPESPGRQ